MIVLFVFATFIYQIVYFLYYLHDGITVTVLSVFDSYVKSDTMMTVFVKLLQHVFVFFLIKYNPTSIYTKYNQNDEDA